MCAMVTHLHFSTHPSSGATYLSATPKDCPLAKTPVRAAWVELVKKSLRTLSATTPSRQSKLHPNRVRTFVFSASPQRAFAFPRFQNGSFSHKPVDKQVCVAGALLHCHGSRCPAPGPVMTGMITDKWKGLFFSTGNVPAFNPPTFALSFDSTAAKSTLCHAYSTESIPLRT
jgi:hypothetical protein